MSEEKEYTERDLVNFGKYLLSDNRSESIQNNPAFDDLTFKEKLDRLNDVYDADLANWKDGLTIEG